MQVRVRGAHSDKEESFEESEIRFDFAFDLNSPLNHRKPYLNLRVELEKEGETEAVFEETFEVESCQLMKRKKAVMFLRQLHFSLDEIEQLLRDEKEDEK